MDFVASWDKKNARWTASRPLSLYVTDNGYMQGAFQNRDQHFGTNGESITPIKNWFGDKTNSFSVAYEKDKTYNIKMVRDLRNGKSWTYIDGVMHGQDTYTTSITSEESKKWMIEIKEPNFTLTHYATKDTAQSITLKNIEIGDAYENGLVIPKDDFKMGDGKSTEFWTPMSAANNRVSGNVFIRLTMPEGKSWHLQAGECKAMWNADKKWGVCNNWAYNTFTGQVSTTYSTINSWGNMSCYQYEPSTADTIKVTFEFDRNNKTVKTYTDKGGYYEYAYNDNNFSSYPANIKLSCDTGAINVETDVIEEYGEVVPIGLNIKNSKEEVVNEFTEGENYYITTCNDFLDTEIVLYAWYDENGALLKADQRSVSRHTINANTKGLSVRNDFKTVAPQGANILKAYLWDSTLGLKPLCDAVTVQKAVESVE